MNKGRKRFSRFLPVIVAPAVLLVVALMGDGSFAAVGDPVSIIKKDQMLWGMRIESAQ
ncbi:MAG: hypothetical protein P4M00_09165 [Azospirillaceae bacterium]|nr:hypothetical protein [Azospirillaceae bacterium]